MKTYRAAFLVTLAIVILLAGALTFLWLDPQGARARISSLVPRRTTDSHPNGEVAPPAAPEADLVPVTLTPQRMQSIGVKTGTVEYRQVHDEILTTGNVEADETRLAEVQVRYAGWIQKVFADSTFKQVRKGQPLLTIYSPELVRTESEYMLAKQNRELLAKSTVPGVASGANTLVSSAT